MAQREDYARILSTNEVPNPEEVIGVQRGIDRLKTEIAEAKARLQELEEELRLHEAVFSPMRQMPVEILGQIFSLALPDVLWDPGRQDLVDFCLVCHRWRDAALAARWLWSRVGVDLECVGPSLEKIVLWLNRSGTLPKILVVDGFQCELERQGVSNCTEMLSGCKQKNADLAKLLTDGPILDHLDLSYGGSACFRNLVEALYIRGISNPITNWECLRSLTLKFHSEWDDPPDPAESPHLHIPHSITSLNLSLPASAALSEVDDTSGLSLNIEPEVLQRLTNLSFSSDWEGKQWLDMLMHCHNVQTLTLDIFGDPNDLTSSQLSTVVELPNLRTLRLRRLIPVSVNIFRFLRTPNLVALDIQPLNFGPRLSPQNTSFSNKILAFVDQSKCQSTLRQLCIHGWSFTDSDEDMATLLHGLPFITHLTLRHLGNATFFRKIRSPSISLPRLEVLELPETDLDIPFDDILVFLKPRLPVKWCDGTPICHRQDTLKEVIVTYQKARRLGNHRDDDNPYVNALRRCCGMAISVGPREYYGEV